MDGTQLHLPNTDTDQFYTQIGLGQSISNEPWNDTIEGCISDTFVVSVDEEILFSLVLGHQSKNFSCVITWID